MKKELIKMQLQLLSEQQTEGNATDPAGEGSGTEPQVKTYTEEEVQARIDETIKKRLERERKNIEDKVKREREEAAELAKLSEAEKQQRLFEKQKAEFEETKKAFERERMLNETTKQMAEKGLPVSFAEMLCGSDAETTLENINTFEEQFNTALEAALNERLKGKAIKTGTSKKTGLTAEQVKAMSIEEINKHWAEIKEMNL